MNGKERITALLNKKIADRVGFWLGNPADETKEIYCKHFGIECDLTAPSVYEESCLLLTKKSGKADIELSRILGSDFFWCSPELDGDSWKHPEGKPMFEVLAEGKEREKMRFR